MRKNFLKLKKIKRVHLLLGILLMVVILIPVHRHVRRRFESILQTLRGKKTVNDRMNEFGTKVTKRLSASFAKIDCVYPPESLVFIFFKDKKLLEIWVSDNKKYKYLKNYPILGLNGTLGPKLKEGDGQVPEGIYEIESLNPNSMFHLSIRLNYPNKFDIEMGRLDQREELGSDIMIHGGTCSVGCLAMGDQATEDLFILSAITGVDNVKIIISPIDFRVKEMSTN